MPKMNVSKLVTKCVFHVAVQCIVQLRKLAVLNTCRTIVTDLTETSVLAAFVLLFLHGLLQCFPLVSKCY